MTGYGYIHGVSRLPDTDRLNAELARERQRADYWENRFKARTSPHSLPLTNAAGEIEPPLPTTEAERE